MLVLTRKTQQQIQIGNNIVVTILQVKGQAVSVGIAAPRNVRVLRSEIMDKKPASATETEAAEKTPRSRGAKTRVPGKTAETKPFSSPGGEQSGPAGESRGLFPHLRRRSQPLDDEGPASAGQSPFCETPLRGLAMQIR